MISDKLQTIFLIIFFVLVVLGFLWKFYPGTFYFSDNSKANNSLFVTFDTAKYINSKREMTARLLGSNEQQNEIINVLARVEKSTMEILKKHAGNNIVLVKQALVLDDQVPDITAKVLADLGLPVNAPTVQPQRPGEIQSNFSNSDDYLYGKELNQKVLDTLQRRQEQAYEKSKQSAENAKQQKIQGFLP